jgi:hypothetical protein
MHGVFAAAVASGFGIARDLEPSTFRDRPQRLANVQQPRTIDVLAVLNALRVSMPRTDLNDLGLHRAESDSVWTRASARDVPAEAGTHTEPRI